MTAERERLLTEEVTLWKRRAETDRLSNIGVGALGWLHHMIHVTREGCCCPSRDVTCENCPVRGPVPRSVAGVSRARWLVKSAQHEIAR